MSIVLPCVRLEHVLPAPHHGSVRATSRLTPLMLALSSALALAPNNGSASNRIVTNCLDDGSVGSLRYQVAHAVNDDVIDLSTKDLVCSSITLTNGAISESLSGTLTLKGPTGRAFTITSGGNGGRIFEATGAVTSALNIYNLTAFGGVYSSDTGDVKGGCIYSLGYVRLVDAIVSTCLAYTATGNAAYGGGIYAREVKLTRSRVSDSESYSGFGNAYGGGVFAFLYFQADYATVSGNHAISRAGNSAGGGVKVKKSGSHAGTGTPQSIRITRKMAGGFRLRTWI